MSKPLTQDEMYLVVRSLKVHAEKMVSPTTENLYDYVEEKGYAK